MDLFMPAERVLYDRAYYLSDEAERDYAFQTVRGTPWPTEMPNARGPSLAWKPG